MFGESGQFLGIQDGSVTRTVYNNPNLVTEVKSDDLGLDSAYRSSVSSRSTTQAGAEGEASTEGSGTARFVKIQERDETGIGETGTQAFDFSAETTRTASDQITKQLGNGETRILDRSRFTTTGQVGGREFTSRQSAEQQINPDVGRYVESKSRSISSDKAGIIYGDTPVSDFARSDITSEGIILRQSEAPDRSERMLDESQQDVRVTRDIDGDYQNLDDFTESQRREKLDQAQADFQDVYGTDFQNFMDRLDNRIQPSGNGDDSSPDSGGDTSGGFDNGLVMKGQQSQDQRLGIGTDAANRRAVENAIRDRVENNIDSLNPRAGSLDAGIATGAATATGISTDTADTQLEGTQVDPGITERSDQGTVLTQDQYQGPDEAVAPQPFLQQDSSQSTVAATQTTRQPTRTPGRGRGRGFPPVPTPDLPLPSPGPTDQDPGGGTRTPVRKKNQSTRLA